METRELKQLKEYVAKKLALEATRSTAFPEYKEVNETIKTFLDGLSKTQMQYCIDGCKFDYEQYVAICNLDVDTKVKEDAGKKYNVSKACESLLWDRMMVRTKPSQKTEVTNQNSVTATQNKPANQKTKKKGFFNKIFGE